MKFVLVCLSVLFLSLPSYAGPQKALKKGFVYNDQGEKCWYTQTFEDGVAYFQEKLTQNIGIIIFDDPSCMTDSGLGLDGNKMMINNLISKWYSHDDADFMTRVDEMFASSPGQIKGECIQSKTYPIIGITVDYGIKDESIYKVVHGSSVGGCTN